MSIYIQEVKLIFYTMEVKNIFPAYNMFKIIILLFPFDHTKFLNTYWYLGDYVGCVSLANLLSLS
jgi:hypothetical protein